MSKKLLILDLDQTLIHSESFLGNDYLEDGMYDFKFPNNETHFYYTRKRPYLKEFIDYAFMNFNVGVWTAAGRQYATTILENIGVDINKLEIFYCDENCTIEMDYDTRDYHGIKNLSKLKKKGYDLEQVLIVDDVPYTAKNNYGNLIRIKPFMYNTSDRELEKLMKYLDTIKDATRVRNIEKRGWDSDKEIIIP